MTSGSSSCNWQVPPQPETHMAKVLVLYYSTYGHMETMANAVAEGARSAGASADIKRVPETTPPEAAKAAHFKLDQKAPVANIEDLANYDAIIVGSPTRFGRISSQMASFLDQAGGLWIHHRPPDRVSRPVGLPRVPQ